MIVSYKNRLNRLESQLVVLNMDTSLLDATPSDVFVVSWSVDGGETSQSTVMKTMLLPSSMTNYRRAIQVGASNSLSQMHITDLADLRNDPRQPKALL